MTMNNTVVKICGNTNIDDAAAALNYGADLLGFIFYEKSPRYITPEKAGVIIKELKNKYTFESIGVFVNPSEKYVNRTIGLSGVDMLQFHGEEPLSFIKQYNKKIIKAFRIHNKNDFFKCSEYNTADYFLLDTFSKDAYGGTGKVFDWEMLRDFGHSEKLFLAGGISSENISEAIEKIRPFGIDLCSSLEKSPGIKDHNKIKIFFEAFIAGNK
jgi:phosphoribosylanthranilate isomerase